MLEMMNIDNITCKDIILAMTKKVTQSNQNYNSQKYNKKALQKSLYFLNQRINIFHFRWGHYGPFSYEIHYTLNDLITAKYIEEICIPDGKINTYNIRYIYDDNSYFETLELSDDLNSSLDRIVEFISDKSSEELELLASVHYWVKRQQLESNEYTIDYIFSNIDALKPSTGFKKSEIPQAIKTLEKEKYLIPKSPYIITN